LRGFKFNYFVVPIYLLVFFWVTHTLRKNTNYYIHILYLNKPEMKIIYSTVKLTVDSVRLTEPNHPKFTQNAVVATEESKNQISIKVLSVKKTMCETFQGKLSQRRIEFAV